MARLIVRDIVVDDVDAIANHIAADNLDAALRFYGAAQDAFEFLASTPHAGPDRPVIDGVDILRVVHGARDIAALLLAR